MGGQQNWGWTGLKHRIISAYTGTLLIDLQFISQPHYWLNYLIRKEVRDKNCEI
jgi:hypothetical protein